MKRKKKSKIWSYMFVVSIFIVLGIFGLGFFHWYYPGFSLDFSVFIGAGASGIVGMGIGIILFTIKAMRDKIKKNDTK